MSWMGEEREGWSATFRTVHDCLFPNQPLRKRKNVRVTPGLSLAAEQGWMAILEGGGGLFPPFKVAMNAKRDHLSI